MGSRNTMDRRLAHADFRHRHSPPLAPIEEIEEELYARLSPAAFAPLSRVHTDSTALRDRKLSLPAMTAVVLSLVLRGVPSLSELLRILDREDLLWLHQMRVSKQALSKRFESLPASLFADLLAEVITSCQTHPSTMTTRVLPHWQAQVAQAFSVVWTADNSTLERLRKTTRTLQATGTTTERLAGMIFAVIESFTQHPVSLEYRLSPHSDELEFAPTLLDQLPEEGLVVLDEGFFQFALFDSFTDHGKFFLTRMRKQVRYESVEVLSEGSAYRDEIIRCGFYRSHPSGHPLRLVSVRWGRQWYQYLSNVLDPKRLSAEHLSQLYRTRWRIETSFNEVKRLLGLAQLWTGSPNGVQIQVYATWIIYTVISHLRCDVAAELQKSVESVSFEMIFRSLYHYSRSNDRGSYPQLVAFIRTHADLLAVVKHRRKRQRLSDRQWASIWHYPIA